MTHFSEKLFLVAFFHYLAAVVLYMIMVATAKHGVRKLAVGLSIGGTVVHTLGLLVRYIEAGLVELQAFEQAEGHALAGWERWKVLLSHPPFTNLYESLVFFAWGVMVIYLVLEFRYKLSLVGLFANALVLLALGLSSLLTDREITPLVPALQSWWLHMHVAMAATGYGAFLVAAVFSFMFLLKDGVGHRRIGLALSLVSVLMLLGVARGTPILSGDYSMTLVSKNAHGKTSLAFAEFEVPARDGRRLTADVELKRRVPHTGALMSLSAFAFLLAAAAYAVQGRKGKEHGRAGDWLFTAGTVMLAGALASFVANATGGGIRISSEEEISSLVKSFAADRFGMAGGESLNFRVSGAVPYVVGMRSNPYDFAILVFLLAVAAFQVFLAFRHESFVTALPEKRVLDNTAYRVTLFAFPMMTLIIVTGAVWAHYAWGRYWGWDPKETWSLITWFVYAFYLHARITHGWTGRPAAVISVIGFAVVIFTYLGVNLGLTGGGLHVYGKG
ncbi:MAG: cytochrome c biogenesis protein CcsA [Deltaproteobacteria bacterium]|nr:cytochrome c biogenesis protein CcsA [Deltaproteobacteria bacterium]